MAGIVIIGSGECGVRAAFALREAGYDGSLVLVGEETALPYERPSLSKDLSSTHKLIRSDESYHEARIERRFGSRAVRLDPAGRSVTFADGEMQPYGNLLLATGARARLFPGMKNCLTLRTDADAANIRARLVPGAKVGIIGGGFIGLELAAAAKKAGCDVTVIEAGLRLLGRAVPAEIAAVLHARHEVEGVRILTGTAVAGTDGRNVTLADGSFFAFDVVIAGIGSVPNTDLAEAAGLAVENGIVVGTGFRTSDPHIFAAGDCCAFEWRGNRVRLESWKAAQDQGAHAASAILGSGDVYAKVPWFWSDQYDLTLQVAGLFEQGRDITMRETHDETTVVFQCDDAGRLIAAAGVGPGGAVAKDVKIFEKLIERDAVVDAQVLADPSQNLKRLLKAA